MNEKQTAYLRNKFSEVKLIVIDIHGLKNIIWLT